jgi:glycosyltransferase involved in cell wall biosynthesis
MPRSRADCETAVNESARLPLVSAILPTSNRRSFLPGALECFFRQDYPHRELIVVDHGTDNVADLVSGFATGDTAVRYIRLDSRRTIGAKRNLACAEARGEIIIHWDDDDWAAPWRVSYQTEQLTRSGASICGLDRLYYYEPSTARAWEYKYPGGAKPWVAGNTLCYRKSFWQAHPFPDVDLGEDARFVWQAPRPQVLALDDKRFIVAFIHGTNISPKRTSTTYWTPQPVELVRALMGAPRMATKQQGAEPTPRNQTMTNALKSDLDLPEFAAYRLKQNLPWMRTWELPWSLFAARLTDDMSVLDCTINPAGFGGQIARLYPRVAYRHWNPIQDGAFALPEGLPAGAFDRVFCINTLEHLLAGQRQLLAAELARVLKPGGRLILTGDYYFESFWVRPEILRTGVVRADRGEVFNGFNKVTSRDWVELTRPYGLTPVANPPEDPREDDLRLFRNPPPYPHAAIGGVFLKAGPQTALARRRVLLSLLTWNTRQASIDSVHAHIREAEMLERLGCEPLLCVVDNGSTDGTAKTLQEIDARVRIPHRFVFNDRNLGNSIARNQIIGYAREISADYVLFMDGDIELVPFSSFAMLRYLETQGTGVGRIGASSSHQTPVRERTAKSWYSIDAATVSKSDIVSWTQYGMYRREVFDDQIQFDESGPFDGPGWGYEDNDLAFQMQTRGYSNDFFPGMVYLHRNVRSSVVNLRRSGLDASRLCQERKQYVIDKWAGHPEISSGPLEVIRRMRTGV